jgi:hypothetical protein
MFHVEQRRHPKLRRRRVQSTGSPTAEDGRSVAEACTVQRGPRTASPFRRRQHDVKSRSRTPIHDLVTHPQCREGASTDSATYPHAAVESPSRGRPAPVPTAADIADRPDRSRHARDAQDAPRAGALDPSSGALNARHRCTTSSTSIKTGIRAESTNHLRVLPAALFVPGRDHPDADERRGPTSRPDVAARRRAVAARSSVMENGEDIQSGRPQPLPRVRSDAERRREADPGDPGDVGGGGPVTRCRPLGRCCDAVGFSRPRAVR